MTAIAGDLEFDTNADLTSIPSSLVVGEGRQLTINDTASFQMVELQGGSQTASIAANSIRFDGELRVEGAKGRLIGDVRLRSDATATITESSTLEVIGDLALGRSQIRGAGSLVPRGAEILVDDRARIDVSTFDWDGQNGVTSTVISGTGHLIIDSLSLETTDGGDGFDGNLYLAAGAELAIGHADWLIQGELIAEAGTTVRAFTEVTIDHSAVAGTAGELHASSLVNRGTLSLGPMVGVQSAVTNDGVMRIHDVGVGTTHLGGDFVQTREAVVLFDLFGAGAGEFDSFVVDGSVDLEGVLGGAYFYSPEAGEEFRIIAASHGISGTFDTVALPMLPSIDLQWWVDYRAEEVILRVIPAIADVDFDGDGDADGSDIDALMRTIVDGSDDAMFDLNSDGEVDLEDLDIWLTDAAHTVGFDSPFIYGDANLDGFVDVSDFNLWSASKFTSTARWTRGDFNADGVIDASDFNIWNMNKFRSSMVAVPEPAGVILWILGLGCFMRRSVRSLRF